MNNCNSKPPFSLFRFLLSLILIFYSGKATIWAYILLFHPVLEPARGGVSGYSLIDICFYSVSMVFIAAWVRDFIRRYKNGKAKIEDVVYASFAFAMFMSALAKFNLIHPVLVLIFSPVIIMVLSGTIVFEAIHAKRSR